MQEKRTPIFQNEDGSWGHVTQTVNPLICTIEYSYNTGFPSKKEADKPNFHKCFKYKIAFLPNQCYN